MDEQSNIEADELGLDTAENELDDTNADDTEGQETEPKDEQKHDTLELGEVEPEKGKAELAREQLVESWTKKIKSGEKSLEEIPSDQSWLKALVQKQVGQAEPNLDEVVERKLAERETVNKFNSLKSELQSMDLNQDQRAVLEAKYKAFRSKGLTQLDSLEASMEIAGVNPSQQALDARMHAARLRTPGQYSKPELSPSEVESKEGFGAVVEKCDPEQTWEQLKKDAQLG